ncbi:tRNA pseudouridine(55) synthase TruB [Paucilactobacillus nenjiangensis]|uniref:tRNA pseudouridine synthase B n=1 Tax=Paucilactobacillus nenjiangensis TaxID=1296540 RepID=A0A5P1X4M4_9LACO|nr:tRNA pseudouridine(55) synthase TruB [Paucilactobacillus nenjiangensis]QER67629.1 tRNA pseudouridine(55) synthase TruB [Paucilactobacillus nenjiangensis]
MNGIIPLFKERGITSHDCVSKIRKILHTKKVGHSGTLDPNVDGVLPIAIGSATKVVELLMESGKMYKGELLIGYATTTQDLDGEIIESKPLTQPFTDQQIKEQMLKLTGDIIQIPPMYSAIKVNGRKLYEYARAGETVERPKRQIHISRFDLISSTYDEENQQQRVRFEAECSKGTYIRTLAVDLANLLGYPGVMSDLTRIKSGGFNIDQTVTLADIQAAMDNGTIDALLNPIDIVLTQYPKIELTEKQWKGVQNGMWMRLSEIDSSADTIAMRYNNEIKALYSRHEDDNSYKPLKMFSVQ